MLLHYIYYFYYISIIYLNIIVLFRYKILKISLFVGHIYLYLFLVKFSVKNYIFVYLNIKYQVFLYYLLIKINIILEFV